MSCQKYTKTWVFYYFGMLKCHLSKSEAISSRFLIQDDVKIARLVRAWDCAFQGCRFQQNRDSPKQIPEQSSLFGFELHGLSNKGTKLLFHIMKSKHQLIKLLHSMATVRIRDSCQQRNKHER